MKLEAASRIVLCGILAGLALFTAAGLHAQNYPTKPIRLVVPFASGGGTDMATCEEKRSGSTEVTCHVATAPQSWPTRCAHFSPSASTIAMASFAAASTCVSLKLVWQLGA